jgi:hypothetical protein
LCYKTESDTIKKWSLQAENHKVRFDFTHESQGIKLCVETIGYDENLRITFSVKNESSLIN